MTQVGRPAQGMDAKTRKASKGLTVPVLADKVMALRKSQTLSQGALAKLADIGLNTLRRMEKGEADQMLSTIDAVADALGVEPWELIKK